MKIKYPRAPDIRGRNYIYPSRNGFCLYCGKDLSFDGRRISFCCNEHSKLYDEKFTWEVQKEAVFARDNYSCVKCGFNLDKFNKKLDKLFPKTKYSFQSHWSELRKYVKEKGFDPYRSYIEADHIKAIATGGNPFDLQNLQTLCYKCHKEKTKQDMKIMSNKRMICKEIKEYWNRKKRETKLLRFFA